MEQHKLSVIKSRFEQAQAAQETQARRSGRIKNVLDRIFPSLQAEPPGSGDPATSIYEGSVDGVDRIIRIMHNQQAGRSLDDGLVPRQTKNT